jgi:Tfp pilus assembly protein FimT
MMSGAADMQVRGAANRLAADLDYAKNMAITHQRPFTVVFDDSTTTANGYKIQRQDASTILNPVSQRDFDVRFSAERSLSRVRISAVALTPTGTTDAITFDYLGTPHCGELVDTSGLISGCITLTADGASLKVVVEPMTGYITITP